MKRVVGVRSDEPNDLLDVALLLKYRSGRSSILLSDLVHVRVLANSLNGQNMTHSRRVGTVRFR
jgi:hypothetical protein